MNALSVRRTWIVREGRDGRDLFCVYAASMPEARRSASESLDRIGANVAFTVHATPAQQLPDGLTSGRNLYAAAFEALPAA